MMQDLDDFLKQDRTWPPLVVAGLLYYQLETVHPFVDGNGRVARLAVQLSLGRERGLWPQFIGLASVFARDPRDHFERLQRVRLQGHWEGWISYFLGSIREAAEEGRRLLKLAGSASLRASRAAVQGTRGNGRPGAGSARRPVFPAPDERSGRLGDHGAHVRKHQQPDFQARKNGLLTEISGRRRAIAVFCYQPFLTLMQDG